MSLSTTRRARAFTLVELLTVISIIALLVTMLLPYLGRARELVYRTRCQANLKVIGGAAIAYLGVWRCFPPSGLAPIVPASDGSLTYGTPYVWWFEKPMLGQYMGCDVPHSASLPPRGTPLRCPSRAFSLVSPGVPPNPENSWIAWSWSIVPWPGYTPPNSPMHRVYYRGARLEEFRNPASSVAIYHDGRGFNNLYVAEVIAPYSYSTADYRHSGGVNYLFADNHVQYIAKPDEAYLSGKLLQP